MMGKRIDNRSIQEEKENVMTPLFTFHVDLIKISVDQNELTHLIFML
jgi:hypothetical protein